VRRDSLDAVPTADGHFCADQGHVGVVVENEATILAWLRRSTEGRC
jgi:hypothetical protein